MKPEKITFNPYKNEYEKLLEVSKRNSKICILVFVLGMLLGIFASALVAMLT